MSPVKEERHNTDGCCAKHLGEPIFRPYAWRGRRGLVVEAGCLLAYGWDYVALAKQAARISDRVLKGAKPSSLAIESPEFYLSLNLKTAAAIGLNIPDDINRQASTVVR